MKNQQGFVSMGILIAIVLGLIVVGGGAYFFFQNNDLGNTHPSSSSDVVMVDKTAQNDSAQANEPSFEIKDLYNGKTSFISRQLGFSLEYPSSREELTLHTKIGKILVNGSLTSAQATDVNSLHNFVTGDRGLFYVQGSDYESYTEGIPIKRLLEECATQNTDCIKKRNGNNVEYYYFDDYPYVVGELHLALIPLPASTLVVSVSRTDSSEMASTMAEEQDYFNLIESIRLTK